VTRHVAQEDWLEQKAGQGPRRVTPHGWPFDKPGVVMAAPHKKKNPEDLVSLSELARLAFRPTEHVRRRVISGKIVPDFRLSHGILFRRSRVGEILSILR